MVKRVNMGRIIAIVLLGLGPVSAFAESWLDFGFSQKDIIGACGRPIPRDKTRHLRMSSIDLLCDVKSDNYIRTPQRMEYDDRMQWQGLETYAKGRNLSSDKKQEARAMMQTLGQRLPLITWQGSIPYNTIETWYWESEECGHNAFHCGTHEECTTDSDGEEHCVDVANYCCWDEGHTEYRHCSSEVMTYDAKFVRNTAYKPGHPDYYDIIPNGYDLLPGEVENIAVFTNSAEQAVLDPMARVENAWNDYNVSVKLRGIGESTECQQKVNRHASVEVHTVRRVKRQTPNAFRVPHELLAKPLEWIDGPGRSGKTEDRYPFKINLTDAAEEVIDALAAHSRSFAAEREAAKASVGKGRSSSVKETRAVLMDEKNKADGFWNQTQVRIRVMEPVGFTRIRDVHASNTLYSSANLASREGLYTLDTTFNYALQPFTQYEFRVSMYRKGVPFYTQREDLYLKYESSFYSKELPLEFETLSFDDRSSWIRWNDWWGATNAEKFRIIRGWFR